MAAATFLFFILLAFVQESLSQNSCTTPNRRPGKCIEITNCPSLYAIAEQKPIAPDNLRLLRRYRCGSSSTVPMVCCPNIQNLSVIENRQSSPQIANNNQIPELDTCGRDLIPKIIGGTETNLGEFPWLALLQYSRSNGVTSFKCGGTLISSRYVLTAAHCIRNEDVPRIFRLVSVRLGEHNITSDPDCLNTECAPTPLTIPIESTIVHENYQPNADSRANDIALIRLSRSVSFDGAYVQPICLPLKNNQVLTRNFVNDEPYVAGWGFTENRTNSDVKRKVRVPVVDNTVCNNRYRPLGGEIISSHICAGGRAGQDSCKGDSGGPLMAQEYSGNRANWYVIGVVSFGPTTCGTQNIPGAYVRVSEYTDWLSRNIVA